jgi:lipoyl(octanoyl) transferase
MPISLARYSPERALLPCAEPLPAAETESPVAWYRSKRPVGYPQAVAAMEAQIAAIAEARAPETIWLLEHPALYTAGTSADPAELLDPHRLPVYKTGRGGRYTYHGPGQRIAYVILDLRSRGGDVRAFVRGLEQWLIATLATFGVNASRCPGEVGVWAETTEGAAKIASIGIRVRHGISFHGVSLNVAPDLTHFSGIVPCGLKEGRVTSLEALGIAADMEAVDRALMQSFPWR